jgi:hypothetical protein
VVAVVLCAVQHEQLWAVDTLVARSVINACAAVDTCNLVPRLCFHFTDHRLRRRADQFRPRRVYRHVGDRLHVLRSDLDLPGDDGGPAVCQVLGGRDRAGYAQRGECFACRCWCAAVKRLWSAVGRGGLCVRGCVVELGCEHACTKPSTMNALCNPSPCSCLLHVFLIPFTCLGETTVVFH